MNQSINQYKYSNGGGGKNETCLGINQSTVLINQNIIQFDFKMFQVDLFLGFDFIYN